MKLAGPIVAALCMVAIMASAEDAAKSDYVFPTDAAHWRGASKPDRPGAVRWEFAKSKYVAIADIPHDWSAYTAIAFTVDSNKASSSKLYLIISSEDRKKHGPDYYSLSIRIAWKGPRRIVLPFKEIGHVRSPVGWHKIDRLTFHNAWSPKDKPDPKLVLKLEDIRLLSKTTLPSKGPRMTDEQLFADLDYPGLEKVKAAVAAGDLKTARHELAEHIRYRTKPLWRVNPRDRITAGMKPQKRRHERGTGGRYRASIKIDWTGWKLVALPKSAFKVSGKPIGWDWVSALWLRVSPTEAKQHPGAVLHLDDCKLVGKSARRNIGDFESEATGWRNVYRSEEQAHSGKAAGKWWFLDLMPTTKCDKIPGDWTPFDELQLWVHAEKADGLTVHVVVVSYLPNTTYADTILSHKFGIGSFRKKIVDFGPRIDWSQNAMDEGESRTIEWNAQLNRHFHFASLVRAYWETGEEKYARELAQEMNAWIEDCPVLLYRSGNSPYHYAWETLNTACRLQTSWPNAIFSCIQSPEFTDDIIVNIVKSVAEHARHLIKNPTSGNWLTAESLGVLFVGSFFPEYKDAKEWRRIGLERLCKQLTQEVYPDGLEYELALGYNNWVLSEFCAAIEIAKLNDHVDEVPADFKALIEKMFDYQMYNCMPNGFGVGLNDSGNANVKKLLLDGYRLFPKRSDFAYAISDGKYGHRPPADSIAMPYSGHYIMRSGWDRNARMLHMDAGRFGYGHQHEDKLHIAMYAYGKQLLPDSGSYMYDRSRWRAYVLLTRAHNTVLVDGMDQFRRRSPELRIWPKPWDKPSPLTDARFATTRGLDYCVGCYNHLYREYVDYQHPIDKPKTLDTVTHTRRVLFVKPDFWIVHDTLAAKDDAQHTADALFHIEATTATVAADTNAVTSACDNAPNVTIFPLNVDGLSASVVKGKTEPPVQGWTSCNKRWHPIPTAIFHKSWKRETDIICALYPFPAGAAAPIKSAAPLGSARGAKFTFDDGSEQVYIANPKPGALVESDGVSTDGEAAFACAAAGKELRLLLVNGKSLSMAGNSVTLGDAESVSVAGHGDGVYVVSADAATACTLALAEMAQAKAHVQVHQVDREGNRVAQITVQLKNGGMSLHLEAGAAYEVNLLGKTTLKDILSKQTAKAGSNPSVDFPVKALAPLPPARGVMVKVQAEAFTAQGGGKVTITDKKVAADGKAFLNWDNAGHWLEWKFSVPQDGAYQLTLKFCTNSMGPVRAIAVDGALPAEFLGAVSFPHTGGWSNSGDDWQLLTIQAPKSSAPFLFNLRKGAHTLRMVNVQESMNMDYFVVHSADVTVK